MCGICGHVLTNTGPRVLPNELVRMCDAIKYRGPDDAVYFVSRDGRVGLGMRRLSIIDLEGGKQPFFSEDGRIICVVNGEIYNFLDLRRELEDAGHHFRSRSDCEVVVHAYESYGLDFLMHLQGMFSIALYDRARDCVLLARDRFGIKPLYYGQYRDGICWTSEIKSILVLNQFERRVNPVAFQQYLWNASVPDPLTMSEGIKKLPPAHYLVIDCKNMRPEVHRYWSCFADIDETAEATPETLEARLRDSVLRHLQSDVPVGILLSGGVDSTAVTVAACEVTGEPLPVFSVGFDIPGYSEFVYSRAVAQKFSCPNFEVTVTDHEYWDLLQECIWFMDEPVADLAMPAMYRICSEAKKHVQVLLSGEGSDDLFGGYAGRLTGVLRYASLFGRLGYLVRHGGSGSRLRRLLQAFRDFPEALRIPLPVWMPRVENLGWNDAWLRRLLSNSPIADVGEPSKPWLKNPELYDRIDCTANDPLNQLLYVDLNVNLPATLLMKADKMSMGASVELRVPFLGDDFARYALSMASHAKLNHGEGKALLKKTLEKYFSCEFIYRRKRGWPVPIGEWLRGFLRPVAETYLFGTSSDFLSEWVDIGALRDAWNLHLSGSANLGLPLWQLVLASLWAEKFEVNP